MTTTAQTKPASNLDRVEEAFSAQAPLFDAYDAANPVLQWMRRQVYKHQEAFLPPGANILELNAGTGIDAVHFARQGHTVVATDYSEGMIREIANKVHRLQLEDRVRVVRQSFVDLDSFLDGPFDHVFSNFGGLNCIPDLRPVTGSLPRLLKAGATVTFVLMPPVCPWELLHLAAGNSRLALRRFSKNGAPASIEGVRFQTYYFSLEQVVQSFGKRFTLLAARGLASLSPPPHMGAFALKHPRSYNALASIDEAASTIPPFNRWADHIIVTMKYIP